MLAASAAACGATLAFDDDPPPGGAVDASTGEGAPSDGGVNGDAVPSTCSADCAPGRCEAGRCTPFLVWQEKGADLVGVTSWGEAFFFTDARLGSEEGRVVRLQRSIRTDLHLVEPEVGSVKAVGDDLLMWAKGSTGAETYATIFRSTFAGADRRPATSLAINKCRGFVHFPPSTFFCGHASSANITRVVADVPSPNWVFGGDAVLFVDGADPDVVWSTPTSLRTAKKDALDAGAGTPILGGISPVGVAVRPPWVYFTQNDGSLWRVRLDGTNDQMVAAPPTPGPGRMGDLTVTPDGTRAYWVDDDMIMGVVLTP